MKKQIKLKCRMGIFTVIGLTNTVDYYIGQVLDEQQVEAAIDGRKITVVIS